MGDAVVGELTGMGIEVARIAGADRQATSAAVATDGPAGLLQGRRTPIVASGTGDFLG